MNLPVQIVFRGMDPPASLEVRIRRRARKLEAFVPDVRSCHVVVERRDRRCGRRYAVEVGVRLSGLEVFAGECYENENPAIAMRGAFDAICRRLERRAGPGVAPTDPPVAGPLQALAAAP